MSTLTARWASAVSSVATRPVQYKNRAIITFENFPRNLQISILIELLNIITASWSRICLHSEVTDGEVTSLFIYEVTEHHLFVLKLYVGRYNRSSVYELF